MHPKGEELERLLEASARSDEIRTGKQDLCKKRERAPDFFKLMNEKRFRTALDVQVFAAKEAVDGRLALAEWCTRKWCDSLQRFLAGPVQFTKSLQGFVC